MTNMCAVTDLRNCEKTHAIQNSLEFHCQ